MNFDNIQFTVHAIQRMFERGISTDGVIEVLNNWNVISFYPDDKPYPSYLLFGLIKEKPIHVVVSIDSENKICYVITVYHPDPKFWQDDFRQRRE